MMRTLLGGAGGAGGACVTVTVWPPTSMLPVRLLVVAFTSIV
jgi:hypothetical protein